MPLRIKCPTGHTLIVPDDRAGRTLECPRCHEAVVVPAGDKTLARAIGVIARDRAVSGSLHESGHDETSGREAVANAVTPIVKPKSRALLPPPKSEEVIPDPPQPEPPPPAFDEALAPAAIDAAMILQALSSAEALNDQSPKEESKEVLPPEAAVEPVVDTAVAVESPPLPAAWTKPEIVHLGADHGRVLAAYVLAGVLAVAALFSMAPAAWDVAEYIQFPETAFVARWALVLFFLGIVQMAYAVYLFQLPDWTSVWVVTIYSLLSAGIYAALLGLVVISREDGVIVSGLQLADKLAGGKAALWCLSMISLSVILAFFSGRLSLHWRKAESMLRSNLGNQSIS